MVLFMGFGVHFEAFTLHFSAIWCKTQCNMHQNALQYVAKRTAICSKTQPKPMKITILELIYRHFDHLG